MAKTIIVKLRIEDMPNNPASYYDWVEAECKKAGIQFRNGEHKNGNLFRLDDPLDWGKTIWVYEPSD